MRLISIKFLRYFALDIPVYREIFARVGGTFFALLSSASAYQLEGRLRGLTYHQTGGQRPYFIGRSVIFIARERIRLGSDIRLYGWNFLHAGKNGFIDIGAETTIDVYTVIYGQGGLSIGKGCAIASGVTIYTQSNQYNVLQGVKVLDQPVRYAPVVIGDDVWIGACATILPGVSVGDHAIVGAGALVRNDVSSGGIVAGIPARQVGQRN